MTDEPAEDARPLEGIVSLRWLLRSEREPGPLMGALVQIVDLLTGVSMTTATDIEIHAPVKGFVTADLTLLTGEDGRPLGNNEQPSLDDEGSLRVGVFRFMVAELATSVSWAPKA